MRTSADTASTSRIIGLANAGPKKSTDAWLDRESIKQTTYAILEQNFADVPEDRRRDYVEISGGFVRLAADMCEHDLDLAGGEMSAFSRRLDQYIRHRLGIHTNLISLLALFHKVGFKEDVQADVAALCSIANAHRHDFSNAVRAVREAPGFVVEAGRYWYVTPEIVSRVLFGEGWDRWISTDLENILKSLPDHLRQQLIELRREVRRRGGYEARSPRSFANGSDA